VSNRLRDFLSVQITCQEALDFAQRQNSLAGRLAEAVGSGSAMKAPTLLFLCSITALAGISMSQAQLITNGSFEDGFNGWVVSGAADVVSYNSSDGTHSARFNAFEAIPSGVLSQTFPTVPGERYALQFDFGVWGGGATAEQRVLVEIVGSGVRLSNLVTQISGPAGPMTLVTHRLYFWADATNSTLTFRDVSLQTVSTDGHLDNVIIERVASGTFIRVSQVELCWGSQTDRVYQVQYRSTLTTNIWTDLGAPVLGNNPITCTNDVVAADSPQRFYQVVVVR